MRRILCIFLILSTVLCLAACSNENLTRDNVPETVNPTEAELAEAELYPVSRRLVLPDGFTYASAQCAYDGKLWLGGQGDGGAVFASLSTDGDSELFRLPDGVEFVYALCVADDGLTMLAGSMPASYTTVSGEFVFNEQPTGEYSLWTFKNGRFSEETPILERYDSHSMIFKSLFELDGKYYSHCQNMVVCWGNDGAELARYSLGEGLETSSISSMCFVDDEVVLSLNEFGKRDSKLVFLDTIQLGELRLEVVTGQIISGLGIDEDGLMLCTNEGLEHQKDGMLLTWDSVYLPGGYSSVEYMDGVYLFFDTYQTCVTLLEYRPEADCRVSLTVATDQPFGSIYTLAKEFNESQDECYVHVKSYDSLNYGSGTMTSLRTEILSGAGPDIFAFTLGSSLNEIRDESYLLELRAYASEDFCEQTFVPGLIEAVETGNGLYWIPYCFSVVTFTGPDALKDGTGSLLERAEKWLGEHGDAAMFPEWCGRDSIMNIAANFSAMEFVDVDAGISCFNSQDFIDLLKFVGKWTGSAAQGEGRRGLFESETISGFLRLAAIRRAYDGDYMFVGFPALNNSCGMYQLNMKFAISAQCAEPEAAWKFISYALSEEGQALNSGPGFPALVSAFYGQMDEAIENGVSTELDVYEYTEEDSNKLLSLLTEIDAVYESDVTLVGIILSEAEGYFSGASTAEQTADAIQSRVDIYLAERS